MKKYYVFAFLALVLISCAIGKDTSKDAASKAKDYVAIEGVIQNYFDGWLTGDTTLVGDRKSVV